MTSESLSIGGYARRVRLRGAAVIAAALLLVVLIVADLVTGPSGMSPEALNRALWAGPGGQDRAAAAILWQIRLPQTIMAVLVGASLGLSGLIMQTMLANPLASPFTLGFSAAAGFGAALSILLGDLTPLPNWVETPIAAFAMTLFATGLLYLVARLKGAQAEILVLAGIAVLFFFQALQSLVQFMASPEVLQQIVFWLFGSLLKASWTSVQVSGAILALCLPFVLRDAWNLTALRLGDGNAASLGLDVDALRRRCFLLVAALVAGAVSFTGTIGFVGLIAPHVARAAVGEDHRFALPVAAMTGALILVAASVIGKLISPGAVIPVGIITAIAGIPMLMTVLFTLKPDGGR
jgi:iron complex transport system permease protein